MICDMNKNWFSFKFALIIILGSFSYLWILKYQYVQVTVMGVVRPTIYTISNTKVLEQAWLKFLNIGLAFVSNSEIPPDTSFFKIRVNNWTCVLFATRNSCGFGSNLSKCSTRILAEKLSDYKQGILDNQVWRIFSKFVCCVTDIWSLKTAVMCFKQWLERIYFVPKLFLGVCGNVACISF